MAGAFALPVPGPHPGLVFVTHRRPGTGQVLRHRGRLLAERDRFDALVRIVSRTIAELEQSRKDGKPMTSINRPENLFEGVRPAVSKESLRDFPELAEENRRRVSAMSEAEIDAGHRRGPRR
ncbi:hypothetical protein GCM10020367_58600 [Streptomyces sannanensis]|uniref:Uncharacterized protein n=1 Tax=Streptomyces sannanensis TaxID=285536 RepID=A0ABP6SKA9_9ACTN